MGGKILVAYATRYGSTAEVADAIGEELRITEREVNVIPVGEVKALNGYRGAVIGSPIYMGKWLADAQVFVERHQASLRTMPVAFFTVGLSLYQGNEEQRTQAAASMDEVRILVPPAAIGLFAGKLDRSNLSLADRAIVTVVRAPEGDFRNWDAIRAWARDIREVFTKPTK